MRGQPLCSLNRAGYRTLAGQQEKGVLLMEKANSAETLWRVWVDTRRRIISFHEEADCKLLEFRSREMFFNCIDQYTGKQYRYQ